MSKPADEQEAAMKAALAIGETLDEQYKSLSDEQLRQEGYRVGLLHGAQIAEGFAAEVDKVFGEQTKNTKDPLSNEDRILIRKHLNEVVQRCLVKRRVAAENAPVLQGQIQGLMRSMKVVAAYHDKQEVTAKARAESPAPKEKRKRAQETKDRRAARRAKKLKLDNQEVAPPVPAPAQEEQDAPEEESVPDNVVQLPTATEVSDKDVNRFIRGKKKPALESMAGHLGLSSEGGRRDLGRRILEHKQKAG